jgi:hypothetical protein
MKISDFRMILSPTIPTILSATTFCWARTPSDKSIEKAANSNFFINGDL